MRRHPLATGAPLCVLVNPVFVEPGRSMLVHRWTKCLVFVEHRDSLTLRLEAGRLEARSDRDVGVGVRFGTGGPLGYASTNLTPQAANPR